MKISDYEIAGLKLIVPTRHGDARGYFAETYRKDLFAEHGIASSFVQENQSRSAAVGTVRGLHFQVPPFEQAKLVRCIRGALLDVAVDMRRDSPTFGRWAAVELTAENGWQLFIPGGFAHGFCTLEPDTEIFYKVDAYYAPQHEGGIRWDDPKLGVRWPVGQDAAVLSNKDAGLPSWHDYWKAPA